jgi:hypothetical protein
MLFVFHHQNIGSLNFTLFKDIARSNARAPSYYIKRSKKTNYLSGCWACLSTAGTRVHRIKTFDQLRGDQHGYRSFGAPAK